MNEMAMYAKWCMRNCVCMMFVLRVLCIQCICGQLDNVFVEHTHAFGVRITVYLLTDY